MMEKLPSTEFVKLPHILYVLPGCSRVNCAIILYQGVLVDDVPMETVYEESRHGADILQVYNITGNI